MNRRDFTKSLGAAVALPALPLSGSIASATPAMSLETLRFFAIYLTGLQGRFTPSMVQRMAGCDSVQAAAITRKFVADGVITAAQAAGQVVTTGGIPAATRQIRPAHAPDLGPLKNTLERAEQTFDRLCEETMDDDDEQA